MRWRGLVGLAVPGADRSAAVCPRGPPPMSSTRPKVRFPGSPDVPGVSPGRYPSSVVSEFLRPRLPAAQGFFRTSFKILWPSTGHRVLSPVHARFSTGSSTEWSTATFTRSGRIAVTFAGNGRGSRRRAPGAPGSGHRSPRSRRAR